MPARRALRMTLPPVRPPRSRCCLDGDDRPVGRTDSTMPTWEMRSTPSPGKLKNTMSPGFGSSLQRRRALNHAAPWACRRTPWSGIALVGTVVGLREQRALDQQRLVLGASAGQPGQPGLDLAGVERLRVRLVHCDWAYRPSPPVCRHVASPREGGRWVVIQRPRTGPAPRVSTGAHRRSLSGEGRRAAQAAEGG